MNLDSTDAEGVDLNVDLVHAGAGSSVAIESCGFLGEDEDGGSGG